MSLHCSVTVPANVEPAIFMLGTRDVATPLRVQVEDCLRSSHLPVCVDFAGLLVTQSFMDEFLGVLILRHGPAVLEQVVLRNCNEDVRAAASLVASVRSRQYAEEQKRVTWDAR